MIARPVTSSSVCVPGFATRPAAYLVVNCLQPFHSDSSAGEELPDPFSVTSNTAIKINCPSSTCDGESLVGALSSCSFGIAC